MEEKKCLKCAEVKTVDQFYYRGGRPRSYCKVCSADIAKEWRAAYPEKSDEVKRRSRLKHTYGVDVEWYEGMFHEQGGVCAICGGNGVYKGQTNLCIDHNHDTGAVRGLLCNDCNVGLARFKDSPEIARKAAEYLETHK
jgi:hypothetical protein